MSCIGDVMCQESNSAVFLDFSRPLNGNNGVTVNEIIRYAQSKKSNKLMGLVDASPESIVVREGVHISIATGYIIFSARPGLAVVETLSWVT